MAIATTPSQVDVERFNEAGYLVVEDLLDPVADLGPVAEEYAALLDALAARWHAEGHLASTYAELPFGRRLIRVVVESGQRYHQHFEIALPSRGVTETTPIHLGPAVFRLLTSPRLLDVVERLIGPEILSNPIQHVRLKLPERLVPDDQRTALTAQTEWHQDQGVSLPEADATEMVTVWLPMTDVTEANGCLRVAPGSHGGALATHCPGLKAFGSVLRIPDALVGPHVVPVPMRRGSVLFMHRRTMHSSFPNLTDDLRWSFDLRYQPAGQLTGRPGYPDFVARSRRDAASAVADWRVWAERWRATRSYLARTGPFKFHRWTGDEPVCA